MIKLNLPVEYSLLDGMNHLRDVKFNKIKKKTINFL